VTTTNELKAPEERVIKNNWFGHRNQVRVWPAVAGYGNPLGVASLNIGKRGRRGGYHCLCVTLGTEDLRQLAQICLDVADEVDASL
jgi:hypothetical protein